VRLDPGLRNNLQLYCSSVDFEAYLYRPLLFLALSQGSREGS
jgi:hypothetical protein